MIAVAGILYCLQLSVESFSLQVKLGFLSKILLVVGIISLWLFGISDSTKKEKRNRKNITYPLDGFFFLFPY